MREELRNGKADVIHETDSGTAPALTIRYYLRRQEAQETYRPKGEKRPPDVVVGMIASDEMDNGLQAAGFKLRH